MEYEYNAPILSKRTFIGTILISLGVIFCLGITMVGAFTPCINNYYQLMIIYPNAIQISQESNIINYFGFGEISTIWFVEAEADVVHQWYHDTMDELDRARRRDIMAHSGEIPPWWEGSYKGMPIWGGAYRVIPKETGSEIILFANCY